MSTVPTPEVEYNDTDFVYVDVPNKQIVGLVEWDKNGNAIKKQYVVQETTDDAQKKGRGKKLKRFYPWCSVKTAKKVYHVAGKFIEENNYDTFDNVFKKAIKETYWKH